MKRRILAVATAASVIIGISALDASAWNNGPMGHGSYGAGPGYNSPANRQISEKARTISLKIAEDQAELNALLSSPNPDGQRVRQLSEDITARQFELESYGSAGYGGSRHRGYSMMNGSYGMMNSGYACW